MYPYTQWFCWSLSLLNGYFIGGIPHFQTNPNDLTVVFGDHHFRCFSNTQVIFFSPPLLKLCRSPGTICPHCAGQGNWKSPFSIGASCIRMRDINIPVGQAVAWTAKEFRWKKNCIMYKYIYSILYYNIFYYIILCYIMLCYILLYCIILYYVVLYCIILYCIIL